MAGMSDQVHNSESPLRILDFRGVENTPNVDFYRTIPPYVLAYLHRNYHLLTVTSLNVRRMSYFHHLLLKCAVPGGSPGAAECRRPGRARTSRAGSLASFPPPGSQSSASRWWPSRPPPVAPAAR
eukprot:2012590-Pyramimonas_sp.AAC.1